DDRFKVLTLPDSTSGFPLAPGFTSHWLSVPGDRPLPKTVLFVLPPDVPLPKPLTDQIAAEFASQNPHWCTIMIDFRSFRRRKFYRKWQESELMQRTMYFHSHTQTTFAKITVSLWEWVGSISILYLRN